jgi:tRNA pseudouridine55 synthase
MAELTGARNQVPPAFSAKHVEGERAYRRARRGDAVVLPPVAVEIHTFTLAGRGGPDVMFQTEVSSGTYVRSLARELGQRLGCGAHLSELRRVSIGPFTVKDAIPLTSEPATLNAGLRPAREAVRHLPAVEMDAAGQTLLRHGRPVPVSAELAAGPVALVALGDGALVAVAHAARGEARPQVVLGA